jgi:hypothetical protein
VPGPARTRISLLPQFLNPLVPLLCNRSFYLTFICSRLRGNRSREVIFLLYYLLKPTHLPFSSKPLFASSIKIISLRSKPSAKTRTSISEFTQEKRKAGFTLSCISPVSAAAVKALIFCAVVEFEFFIFDFYF